MVPLVFLVISRRSIVDMGHVCAKCDFCYQPCRPDVHAGAGTANCTAYIRAVVEPANDQVTVGTRAGLYRQRFLPSVLSMRPYRQTIRNFSGVGRVGSTFLADRTARLPLMAHTLPGLQPARKCRGCQRRVDRRGQHLRWSRSGWADRCGLPFRPRAWRRGFQQFLGVPGWSPDRNDRERQSRFTGSKSPRALDCVHGSRRSGVPSRFSRPAIPVSPSRAGWPDCRISIPRCSRFGWPSHRSARMRHARLMQTHAELQRSGAWPPRAETGRTARMMPSGQPGRVASMRASTGHPWHRLPSPVHLQLRQRYSRMQRESSWHKCSCKRPPTSALPASILSMAGVFSTSAMLSMRSIRQQPVPSPTRPGHASAPSDMPRQRCASACLCLPERVSERVPVIRRKATFRSPPR